MDFQNLFFSFEGRVRRSHAWLGYLILLVASLVLQAILSPILGGFRIDPTTHLPLFSGPFIGVMGLLGIVFTYMNVAIWAKRAHDRDKTAWFLLIWLIPIIGAIWLLIDLGFLEGTSGPNKYGPSPKG